MFIIGKGADGNESVFKSYKGRRVSALWEGNAARVANQRIILLLKLPVVGMTVKDSIEMSRWHIPRSVDMSVGEEDAASFVHKQCVSGHYRELKQHLVDLRVAVATYGNDILGERIKPGNDTLGVDAFRDTVARSVVEYVAQDKEHVEVTTLVVLQRTLKTGQTAVYVANDEIPHNQSTAL